MGLAGSKLLSQQFRLTLASTHAGDRQKGGQENLQEAPAAVLGIVSCFMLAEALHTHHAGRQGGSFSSLAYCLFSPHSRWAIRL